MIYMNENHVGKYAECVWGVCTVNVYGDVFRKTGVVKRFKRIVRVGGTWRISGSF